MRHFINYDSMYDIYKSLSPNQEQEHELNVLLFINQ